MIKCEISSKLKWLNSQQILLYSGDVIVSSSDLAQLMWLFNELFERFNIESNFPLTDLSCFGNSRHNHTSTIGVVSKFKYKTISEFDSKSQQENLHPLQEFLNLFSFEIRNLLPVNFWSNIFKISFFISSYACSLILNNFWISVWFFITKSIISILITSIS